MTQGIEPSGSDLADGSAIYYVVRLAFGKCEEHFKTLYIYPQMYHRLVLFMSKILLRHTQKQINHISIFENFQACDDLNISHYTSRSYI